MHSFFTLIYRYFNVPAKLIFVGVKNGNILVNSAKAISPTNVSKQSLKLFLVFVVSLSATSAFSKKLPNISGKSAGTVSCTGFKTYTQGGWGADARGNNPGAYRDANFAAAFPSGLTIGCSAGNKMVLTTAAAVNAFLPSGSTPSVLPAGTLTNPGSSYSNVLAGQLVAATLNVGFDAYDANFSSNSINTGNLYITSGTFKGFTVNQLIAAANDVIGGCSTAYSVTDLNVALTSFNENYDNGTTDNGFTTCTSPCNLSVNGTKTDITCNNANNGLINITPSGANGTVTYLWNDGNTSQNRSGLSAGNYSVTAKDAAGCTATSSTFTIINPTAISVDGSTVDVTIVNTSTGSITLSVSGGTCPYTYFWNDGNTSKDRTNLAAGTYSVTVKDKNNCTNGKSFTIYQPTCNLDINGSKTNVTCNSASNGSINITVTGANGGVSFLWNDGNTDKDRNNLKAGDYSFTVTDDAGCSLNSNIITITEPSAIQVFADNGSIDCNGGTTWVNVTAQGGTGTLTGTGTYTVGAGSYTYYVTDGNGCSASKSVTIEEPSKLSAKAIAGLIECKNGTTSVEVTAEGGTSPYSGTGTFTVSAGTYEYTVTDSKGCSAKCSVTIENGTSKKPKAVGNITFSQTNNLCNTNITCSIDPVSGASSYTWNEPENTTIVSGQGTTSIELYISGAFARGVIRVSADNACGSHRSTCDTLSSFPTDPVISGPSCVSFNAQATQYRVINPQAGVTYTWNLPSKAKIVSGQGTSSIVVNWKSVAGNVNCVASNACGRKRSVDYAVSMGCEAIASTNSNAKMMIYPSVTSDKTSMTYTVFEDGKYTVIITDLSGRVVMQKEMIVAAGTNQLVIDASTFASGVYLVTLKGVNTSINNKFIKE